MVGDRHRLDSLGRIDPERRDVELAIDCQNAGPRELSVFEFDGDRTDAVLEQVPGGEDQTGLTVDRG